MTALPGEAPGTVRLICDGCGDTMDRPDDLLRDEEVVWPILGDAGWSGSAFSVGPHTCPACVAPSSRHGRRPVPARGGRAEVLEADDAVVVVRIVGTVDGTLGETLRNVAMTAPRARVVVDLAAAATIDPPGLAALVRTRQDCRARGGSLCLAAPSRFVHTVLHTMRLTAAFPCFADRSTALTSLRSPAGAAAVAASSSTGTGRRRTGRVPRAVSRHGNDVDAGIRRHAAVAGATGDPAGRRRR